MTPTAELTAHAERMINAPASRVWTAMTMSANYRIVRFDLSAHGATATVVLSQANLTGGTTASDIEHRIGHENRLSLTLAALARLLE